MFKFIKQFFCLHIYGDREEKGNYIEWTCEKCKKIERYRKMLLWNLKDIEKQSGRNKNG